MFHWYLLVENFVNLFLDQFGFLNYFSHMFSNWLDLPVWFFDLICLFWVNSVYLSCCYSRNFSIVFDINFHIWLISYLFKVFHWYLLVGNFCNLFLEQFGFWDCFSYILFMTWSACFGSIVFIFHVVSASSSSQYEVWYLVEHNSIIICIIDIYW